MSAVDVRDMNFLVTGGAGLVGGAICRTIARAGGRVTAFDNLSAYPAESRRYLFDSDADIALVRGDVRDSDVVEAALRGRDVVIHAAALADVAACTRMPGECEDVNVRGTATVLAAARRAGVSKAVFVSSASVYGNGVVGSGPQVFAESDAPDPISEYGRSKLAGEEIALTKAAPEHTAVVRYFSVYGGPQIPKEGSHSWAVAIFVMRAMLGLPIELNGGGHQIRDFTHLGDIVEGTIRAAVTDSAAGRILNIGTGQATAIRDVVTELAEYFPAMTVTSTDMPEGDPKGGVADTEVCRKVLNWRPGITFSDGVRQYVDWMSANPSAIPTWLRLIAEKARV
ncbi:NAD-dependent epimerase/dehydratase family protein [Nocardia niwae]|uniref:NAD-dependent epimerase/dehydratase family protein n=1 Tax=Nocardia niwae TaxID=626084 RepID=UPI0007C6A8A5|nr:NAD-dependent epimerase/dehydratase family protein [Nocardia niwae]